MSATVPEGLLETVDNPVRGNVVGILPEERTGECGPARRGADHPTAGRRTWRLQSDRGGGPDRHRPGTLTLVVLNTVQAARAVYKALRSGSVESTCCILGFVPWSGPS